MNSKTDNEFIKLHRGAMKFDSTETELAYLYLIIELQSKEIDRLGQKISILWRIRDNEE